MFFEQTKPKFKNYFQLDSFEIIYPSHQVKSNMESCLSQEKVLFVNSIEARRESQRKIRFGFKISDEDIETLDLRNLRDRNGSKVLKFPSSLGHVDF